MPQPTPYDRITNFQNEQALAPTAPHPAPMFDAEYNAIKITIDEILQNLALIQRDDGQLANDSVGRDQLKDEVLIGFGAPEPWEGPNHDYIRGDTVFQDNAFWFCEVSHTSTTFATDYAAGYWSLIANFNDAATVGAKLFVQDGPPVGAVHGQQWWESDTGNLFVFYVDPGGGAGQWVHTNSGAGGGSATGGGLFPELLTANRTYYVRTDGNDSHDGLADSAAGAFLTFGAAFTAVSLLDFNGFVVTVKAGNETGVRTFTANNTLQATVGPGTLIVSGNGSTRTVFASTSGDTFQLLDTTGLYVTLTSMQINAAAGYGARAAYRSTLAIGADMAFGACASGCLAVHDSQSILQILNTTLAVVASSPIFIVVQYGHLYLEATTITFSPGVTFSDAFLFAYPRGTMQVIGNSYSGTATGRRYQINYQSLLNLAGAAESTALPGTLAGICDNSSVVVAGPERIGAFDTGVVYTPAITWVGGTPPSPIVGGRQKTTGNFVYLSVTISPGATLGGATGFTFTLPGGKVPATDGIMVGYDAATGSICGGKITSGSAQVTAVLAEVGGLVAGRFYVFTGYLEVA